MILIKGREESFYKHSEQPMFNSPFLDCARVIPTPVLGGYL